jgi:xylulokinase
MWMGIDVGTTAVKVIVLDDEGRVAAQAVAPHHLHSPSPGWAEESAEDWWRGVVAACRFVLESLDGKAVKAIGVSGMVPALVVLGSGNEVLRLSIQQNDARATQQIDQLGARFSESELFERTGATWNQQLVAPKLLWIRDNEPAVWKAMRRITGSYEYITYRLTGVEYAEANWALESGLWDAIDGRWMGEVLELLELDDRILAPMRWPQEIVGTVSPSAAEETGLRSGIPVIAGSADHIAAALASGMLEPGQAVVKLGGAGDFLYSVDSFCPMRELFIDYHNIPGAYVLNGCMATSGSLVKWYREQFRVGMAYDALDAEATRVPAGSDKLVILPYFLGEKTPIHDPYARGTMIGLTLSHTSAHIYRGILEAVAYAFRHHVEVLEAAGHGVEDVYVIDGGARSALWRGIIASVLNRPLKFIRHADVGSAYGVALVAGVGTKAWGWGDMHTFVTPESTTKPTKEDVGIYENLYEVYRESYLKLKAIYRRLQ